MKREKLPWSYAEDDAVGFFVHESALAVVATDGDAAGNGHNPTPYISQLLNAGWYIEVFRHAISGSSLDVHVLAAFVAAAFKYITRSNQDVSPEGGFGLGPCWESSLSRFDGFDSLLFGG